MILTSQTKRVYPKGLQSEVDYIMTLPRGSKRWRAAVDLWLKLNPVNPETGITAQEENHEIVKENKLFRESLVNKFGGSGDTNSSLRSYMSFPVGAKIFIDTVDPEAFKEQSNAAAMFKTFPEYRRAEVY